MDKQLYFFIRNMLVLILLIIAPSNLVPSSTSDQTANPKVDGDDGSRIDVLVVYDQSLVDQFGSDSAVQNALKNIIDLTNQSFINSQVNFRISLVGASLIDFDESTINWADTLAKLLNPADGILDEVPVLRNTTSADLVVFLVDKDDGVCAMSNHMTVLGPAFESTAYAIVDINCTPAPTYAFAHELGHLMGSVHDHQSPVDEGIFPYSYGFQDPSGTFRTIMASNFNCPLPCPRINYWSNPDVGYLGLATGDGTSNNALSLNNAASTVANFRDGPPPLAPSGLIASTDRTTPLAPIITLTWTDNSQDETRFDVDRSLHDMGAWTNIGSVSQDITLYTDASPVINQKYDYRVRAHSGDGDSTSNTATASTFLPPVKPENLSAVLTAEGNVQLTWNALPGSSNQYGKADTINVERKTSTGGWQSLISLTEDATGYTDSTVVCATDYSYRILGVNSGGISDPSNPAAVSTGICAPPQQTIFDIWVPLILN